MQTNKAIPEPVDTEVFSGATGGKPWYITKYFSSGRGDQDLFLIRCLGVTADFVSKAENPLELSLVRGTVFELFRLRSGCRLAQCLASRGGSRFPCDGHVLGLRALGFLTEPGGEETCRLATSGRRPECWSRTMFWARVGLEELY